MIVLQSLVILFLVYAGLAWIDHRGYQRGRLMGYRLGYFDGKHGFDPSYPIRDAKIEGE